MTSAVGSEGIPTRCGREIKRFCTLWFARGAFCASFEAAISVRDAPRAAVRSSDRLAMTKLASPNRLNSCASFFARPL